MTNETAPSEAAQDVLREIIKDYMPELHPTGHDMFARFYGARIDAAFAPAKPAADWARAAASEICEKVVCDTEDETVMDTVDIILRHAPSQTALMQHAERLAEACAAWDDFAQATIESMEENDPMLEMTKRFHGKRITQTRNALNHFRTAFPKPPREDAQG